MAVSEAAVAKSARSDFAAADSEDGRGRRRLDADAASAGGALRP